MTGIRKYVPTNKICTYCSMNKQYMKRVQKWQEFYLMLWDTTITMTRRRDNVSTVRGADAILLNDEKQKRPR